MSFLPGDLVVCVDVRTDTVPHFPLVKWQWATGLDGLRIGAVYTIRKTGMHNDPRVLALPLVWVEEVRRAFCMFQGDESGFWAGRFRPVNSLRLEVFKAMLAPLPTKEAHKAPESV